MNHDVSFNVARLSEKAGQLQLASKFYGRAARATGGARAHALYRLANMEFIQGDMQDSRHLLEEALKLEPLQGAWHYRLAMVLEKMGDLEAALPHYRTASEIVPQNAAWAATLERCENSIRVIKAKADDERAKLLRRKGERWRELEVLQSAADSFSKSPDWFLRLGDTLEIMNRYTEAAKAFEKANQLRPARAENLFREGFCWEKAGQINRAREVFEQARLHDNAHQSKELGVGVFLERRGMWHEAAAKFDLTCAEHPLDAEVHFRAGRAYERMYFWKEAVSRYRQSTLLDPWNASKHFRLGFALERMQEFSAAEDCYAYGIDLLESTDTLAMYWSYRLAIVRESQGDLVGAADAYAASLDAQTSVKEATPTREVPVSLRVSYETELLQGAKRYALRSDPEFILSIASQFEQREMWQDAIECLEAASDRSQKFTPSIYHRIGEAYRRIDKYEESSQAFRMTRISSPPRGIDVNRYKKDTGLLQHFEYAEMCENLPVREDVIFYESFFGKQITCNPFAIFKSLIADPSYSHCQHVWSVTAETHIPDWMANLENVVFAIRGTYLSRKYMATAKYLINNVTFPPFFIRRDKQRYLNTWHGTPMKTLGKDVRTGVLEHRNVSRNLLQSTHILTSNNHTTDVLLERSDVETLATAKVGYTGYPRIDQTLGLDPEKRQDIRSHLGISREEKRKIVLYAPTWRGGKTSQYFDTERLTSDLVALSSLDCVVLFQGHHLSTALLPADLPVRIVDDETNTNELLAVVDVLVTDYSSIMFDFFPTKRPVICYTYDLAEYVEERGLYFTPKDIGLVQANSTEELLALVESALFDSGRFCASKELLERFCSMEDGNAAERVKSFFFKDSDTYCRPANVAKKTSFLFHHSMLPNGISTSLINLLWSLDPKTSDVTVVVPAGAIEKDDARVQVLGSLPPHVKVLADGGRQVVNIEEKWLIDYLNKWHVLPSETQREIYMSAFEREYRRLFGLAKFDVVVEFEGYSRYWTSVLAAAPQDSKKIIYLHSDMAAEWNMKFPYLRAIFDLYNQFDVLASVSPAISDVNKASMGRLGVADNSEFVALMNQINPQQARQRSMEDLDEDLVPWFSANVPTILSMGRFSLEKDQQKLIRAFARVVADGYNAKLVLLGDGPLRQDLESLVDDLGLREYCYFAGHRENPFPALRAAACFVLSSNHEGQPMVLLESMILGTPIVATDIPGSRQVLSENQESLVENSVDGLAAGIIDVLRGRKDKPLVFDPEKYWRDSRDAFLEATT